MKKKRTWVALAPGKTHEALFRALSLYPETYSVMLALICIWRSLIFTQKHLHKLYDKYAITNVLVYLSDRNIFLNQDLPTAEGPVEKASDIKFNLGLYVFTFSLLAALFQREVKTKKNPNSYIER